ncbi:MAG: hypothetical protein E6Q97_30290 [Desulfurellales bacterium]|nr:MAG: hypothetical protein E6Q97_30290 [Desulfurellales bacterium]
MSMTPSPSTLASVGLGVPIATVGAWLANVFGGIEMPGEVQAALGALISAGIGYAFSGGRARDLTP